MTNRITNQDIFNHMLDLAEENPNRVYVGPEDSLGQLCQYTDSGDTPGTGCIVGEAAVRAGIESDTQHGAIVPPLHLSTNYSFTGLGGKRLER